MEKILSAHEAVKAIHKVVKPFQFKQECFVVLLLDIQKQVIGKPLLIGLGTAGFVDVHPRDVFREAIKRNASSIIISHTHPSGSLEISEEDRRLTNRLQEAGKLLIINVLDHIIVTKTGYLSFMEQNIM